MPTTYTVIRRPLITEKGLGVKETEGTLVFEVASKATKTEVKQAVEALFQQRLFGRGLTHQKMVGVQAVRIFRKP